MAPADRAAITSSLSDISPPAMTGTFTSLHTLRITLGMSPGSISMMSGLATLICFSMFSNAMESSTKTLSVGYRDSSVRTGIIPDEIYSNLLAAESCYQVNMYHGHFV